MDMARCETHEDWARFTRQFFASRIETFRKDIAICLTPNERKQHAYFPALIICVAFAELLSGLYAGTLQDQGLDKLQQYAKHFMKPEYTDDARLLELLYFCLRHKVAHLAYPYTVFDTHSLPKTRLHKHPRRRVTWAIHEFEQRPAIKITDYPTPQPVNTPTPWAVSYDCLLEVGLRSLANDVVWSTEGYLRHLQIDQVALKHFKKCMEDYFPRVT
jgi:hypothetical protein